MPHGPALVWPHARFLTRPVRLILQQPQSGHSFPKYPGDVW